MPGMHSWYVASPELLTHINRARYATMVLVLHRWSCSVWYFTRYVRTSTVRTINRALLSEALVDMHASLCALCAGGSHDTYILYARVLIGRTSSRMRRLDFDDGGRAGQRRPRKFIVRYDKTVCVVKLPPVSLKIRRYNNSSTVLI